MEEIWIDTNQALVLFEDNITKSGLYYIGLKEGFTKKADDGHHYLHEKNKLLKYIKETERPIPDGWISVVEASEKFNVTVGYIYQLIKDNVIKCNTYTRKRINYIKQDSIEKHLVDLRKGFFNLGQTTKIFYCTKSNLLKNIAIGKIQTKRFPGDSNLYVKRKDVEKLFKYRKTDKGSNNE